MCYPKSLLSLLKCNYIESTKIVGNSHLYPRVEAAEISVALNFSILKLFETPCSAGPILS